MILCLEKNNVLGNNCILLFAGLYSIFCVYCIDIRHGVFFLYTRTLVAIRR